MKYKMVFVKKGYGNKWLDGKFAESYLFDCDKEGNYAFIMDQEGNLEDPHSYKLYLDCLEGRCEGCEVGEGRVEIS